MDVLKDKLVVFPFALSFIIFVIALFAAASGAAYYGGDLILNYDNEGGLIIGDAENLISITLILLFILVANLFIVWKVYKKERFMSYLLSFVTPLIAITLLGVVFAVKSIN